jgi:Collagen triple helix repeat (20 copies)
MASTLGPERRLWPHNQEDNQAVPAQPFSAEVVAFSFLPEGGEPGQVLGIAEDGTYIWVDPPNPPNSLALRNGLLDHAVLPQIPGDKIADLSDRYQSLTDRDTPGGYAGLDANGKLSPYAIPELVRGLKGDRGETGQTGERGNTGDRGERGDIGPQGVPGREGPQGKQGVPGERGRAPDMTGFLARPASNPKLSLSSETLAQDLAYRLAELGLIDLI